MQCYVTFVVQELFYLWVSKMALCCFFYCVILIFNSLEMRAEAEKSSSNIYKVGLGLVFGKQNV